MKYYLKGYDKDAGCYIPILTMQEKDKDQSGEVLNRLIEIEKKLKEDMDKDRIINPYTGEPLDWLEVMDEDGMRMRTSGLSEK